jgi:Uma2 family endonuclease
VVEVVSKDDSHAELLKKLAEYHAWGVKHIWSADPWVRKLFVYDNQGYHEVTAFELPEFGATITASELFDQTPR